MKNCIFKTLINEVLNYKKARQGVELNLNLCKLFSEIRKYNLYQVYTRKHQIKIISVELIQAEEK